MRKSYQNQSPRRCGMCRGGLLAGLLLLAGCQAPGMAQPEPEGFSLSKLKFWERDDRDLRSIDGIRGPLQRQLERSASLRGTYDGSLAPLEGQQEFDQAKALFDSGDYEAAQKQFKRVAKRYKDTPIEEEGLFYVAECEFARGRYAKAQDAYDTLLKKYPTPRQLDLMTRRLFDIARTWLEYPEFVETSEIQQVNLENPKATPPPEAPIERSWDPSRMIPIFPNMWDKSRPAFDTDGRALQALRTIWLNDPTGPIADDALMLAASHNLRKGSYLEADRLFEILRRDYPKSPHLENAFILGSHVKLMAYQGPNYDGNSLTQAAQLKESTLRLYPKTEDRERILNQIRQIEEAKAEQEWANVIFWQKKNNPVSVATCCREVIRLYPNSSYASQARDLLAEMQANGTVE